MKKLILLAVAFVLATAADAKPASNEANFRVGS